MYLEFSSSFHVKFKTKLTATLTTDRHVCRFRKCSKNAVKMFLYQMTATPTIIHQHVMIKILMERQTQS